MFPAYGEPNHPDQEAATGVIAFSSMIFMLPNNPHDMIVFLLKIRATSRNVALLRHPTLGFFNIPISIADLIRSSIPDNRVLSGYVHQPLGHRPGNLFRCRGYPVKHGNPGYPGQERIGLCSLDAL